MPESWTTIELFEIYAGRKDFHLKQVILVLANVFEDIGNFLLTKRKCFTSESKFMCLARKEKMLENGANLFLGNAIICFFKTTFPVFVTTL